MAADASSTDPFPKRRLHGIGLSKTERILETATKPLHCLCENVLSPHGIDALLIESTGTILAVWVFSSKTMQAVPLRSCRMTASTFSSKLPLVYPVSVPGRVTNSSMSPLNAPGESLSGGMTNAQSFGAYPSHHQRALCRKEITPASA
jgi:hypothetical protein